MKNFEVDTVIIGDREFSYSTALLLCDRVKNGDSLRIILEDRLLVFCILHKGQNDIEEVWNEITSYNTDQCACGISSRILKLITFFIHVIDFFEFLDLSLVDLLDLSNKL